MIRSYPKLAFRVSWRLSIQKSSRGVMIIDLMFIPIKSDQHETIMEKGVEWCRMSDSN